MKTRFQNSRKRSLSSPGRSSGAAELEPAVEVELRARAARAGRPGLPEVSERGRRTIRSSGTPTARQHSIASSSGPSAELLVAREDRDPDPLGIEPEALGRELPRVLDRALLEVVAEREVPEHLEERQVARGQPDLVDVGRAEALLAGGQPRMRRLLLAQEVGLERLHAGGREQHRRVVRGRHERRRRHAPVIALLEEREERLADLRGGARRHASG